MVSRHQQRLIDGTPWSLQTTFYPMRLVEQGAVQLIQAEDIAEGVVRVPGTKLGHQAGRLARQDHRTRAGPNEAAFFKLPDDGRIAVFEILRTGFDDTASPLRLTISVYPADRNQFVMNGQVPKSSGPG